MRRPSGAAYAPGKVRSSSSNPWKHRSTPSQCAYSRKSVRASSMSASPATTKRIEAAESLAAAGADALKLSRFFARSDLELATREVVLQLLELRHRRRWRIAYHKHRLLDRLRARTQLRAFHSLRLQRSEARLSGFLGAEHAKRNRETLRSRVQDRHIAYSLGLQVGDPGIGCRFVCDRRDEYPIIGDHFDLFLAEELAEIERLQAGLCPRTIRIGNRPPLDTDVGKRSDLCRAERGDLLRAEYLDLVGLDLLSEADTFSRAGAVEPRVGEKRQVGEQQQEDEGFQKFLRS